MPPSGGGTAPWTPSFQQWHASGDSKAPTGNDNQPNQPARVRHSSKAGHGGDGEPSGKKWDWRGQAGQNGDGQSGGNTWDRRNAEAATSSGTGTAERAKWSGKDNHSARAERHKDQAATSANAVAEAGGDRCSKAKLRLLPLRASLEAAQVDALTAALKQRPPRLPDSLLEVAIGLDTLDDMRCVFDCDMWDGARAGKIWLLEWLQDSEDQQQREPPAGTDPSLWCRLCWRGFSTEWNVEQHASSDKHLQKLRSYVWKYGREPAASIPTGASAPAASPVDGAMASAAAEGKAECTAPPPPPAPSSAGVAPAAATTAPSAAAAATGTPGGRSARRGGPRRTAAEALAEAQRTAKGPVAIAKQELLQFRDALSAEKRAEFLAKFGGRRPNDAESRHEIRDVFGEQVYAWVCAVDDDTWVWKEPTFSWASGFYWHPEVTALPQGGPQHSVHFCHLCEVECYDDAGKLTHNGTRRHAENFARWVHRMGASSYPEKCARCARDGSCGGRRDAGARRAEAEVKSDSESDGAPGDGSDVEGNETKEDSGVGGGVGDNGLAGGSGAGGASEEADGTAEGTSSVDLSARRPVGVADAEVPAETDPPQGFASSLQPDSEEASRLSASAVPYVSFVVRCSPGPGNRGRHGYERNQEVVRMRVTSTKVRLGANVTKKCWAMDLQQSLEPCEGGELVWRSLAAPLSAEQLLVAAPIGAAPAPQRRQRRLQQLEFGVLVQQGEGDAAVETYFRLLLQVVDNDGNSKLRAGAVVELEAWLPAPEMWRQRGSDDWDGPWLRVKQAEASVDLERFVGTAQIEASGGLARFRGQQRAVQFATKEVLLSFWLFLPAEEAPAPPLIFLHGDMERGSSQRKLPGLATFCEEYGAANLCRPRQGCRAASAVAKKFVVVTPCCPPEYWWFRHPALHDAKGYAPAMEQWFRSLLEWLASDLGVCPRSSGDHGDVAAGMRLVGQSMGGYAALELARAMPERVAAVAVGAPCFDASRLDWLAQRIVNVPLWIFIGRQDTMCAFEEAASLVLKMKDRDAKLVRLTSYGIRCHNEACKLLERRWVYQWLLSPLA